MTHKAMISELVTKYGLDGLLSMIGDYAKEQAREHEDTVPDAARVYDETAEVCRKGAATVRDILR